MKQYDCAFRLVPVLLASSLAVALCGPLAAQEPVPFAAPPEVDIDDLIAECQRAVRGRSYVGFVWWVPVEFWLESAREESGIPPSVVEEFEALRAYTTVVVVAGRIGRLGTVHFVSGEDLRANIVIRDRKGIEYRPLAEISEEARMLALVLRPVLAQATGRMGESMEVLFFPGANSEGDPISHPLRVGGFEVVLRHVVGDEQVFEFRTPLSSLRPPRFCPAGGERVEANWKFCPWHATPLP